MKNIIVFCFFIMTSDSFAQSKFPIDSITNRISFTKVEEIPDLKKAEIYLKIKEWFVHSFSSSKAVIQVDSPDGGKVIAKAFSTFDSLSPSIELVHNKLWYIISITVKDGKYKYVIDDLNVDMDDKTLTAEDALELLENKPPTAGADFLKHSISQLPVMLESMKKAVLKKDDF